MLTEVPNFEASRILVIGDVILDRYWYGQLNRISPEAPVPIVEVDQLNNKPGGAGNVSMNLAALGCQVSLLGLAGDDDAGKLLQKILTDHNVDVQLLVEKSVTTIVKLRVLGQHQQLIRLDFEQIFDQKYEQQLLSRYAKLLPSFDLVILSDYAKGTIHHPQKFIQLAAQFNIPILVDPKNPNLAVYRGADIVTPNIKELKQEVGIWNDEQQLIDKASNLLDRYDFHALLLTRSEKGMTLLCRQHPPFNVPADAKEVFDVTGAGDTAIAVLGAGWIAQKDLRNAVALANTAAGIVVGKLGAVTVSVHELRRALLQRQADSNYGIISLEELLLNVLDAKAHNETIVMTNGCFDILHAGHVKYLQEAQKLGNRLIVAINSDDSVRKLKGNGRPINSLADRMAVLAELRCVDWVVSFAEDTPTELINKIQPNILVKGGDYTEQEVVGREIVKAYGGEIKVLSFHSSHSTTNIVKQYELFEQQ